MSVQNLFFARPAPKKPSPPLFSITGCGKRCKDVLPAPFFAYFTPSAFYLLLKVKSELASCLLTQGTFKELVGGRPEHCYIKACHRRPRVDRGLQINTHIADEHAKKLPETSVSLKWTVFKLCCSAHLFPNTPRTWHMYHLFTSHRRPCTQIWPINGWLGRWFVEYIISLKHQRYSYFLSMGESIRKKGVEMFI